MESLLVVIPALAIAQLVVAARARRRARAWLTRSTLEAPGLLGRDGERVIEGRRVGFTLLDPVLFAPRVDVDVELTIPDDERQRRLRAPSTKDALSSLKGRARVAIAELRAGHVRVRFTLSKGTPPVDELAHLCVAVARAIEQASIHAVDGEGPVGGAPVAVRAVGGEPADPSKIG